MSSESDAQGAKLSAGGPVAVAVAANEIEAAMITGLLAERGVEARTVGDYTAGFRAEAPGGVSVVVHARDEVWARQILAGVKRDRHDEAGKSDDDADQNEPEAPLSHFDADGAARMVDVGDKPVSRRLARARATVRMQPDTLSLIMHRELAKGDVLETARLAGIMAVKRTSDLIPLCHPLPIDSIRLHLAPLGDAHLLIEAIVEIDAKTGAEMEALTGVSVAALTVYDMCKGVDREMTIEQIRLEEKTGGASGAFVRGEKTE